MVPKHQPDRIFSWILWIKQPSILDHFGVPPWRLGNPGWNPSSIIPTWLESPILIYRGTVSSNPQAGFAGLISTSPAPQKSDPRPKARPYDGCFSFLHKKQLMSSQVVGHCGYPEARWFIILLIKLAINSWYPTFSDTPKSSCRLFFVISCYISKLYPHLTET